MKRLGLRTRSVTLDVNLSISQPELDGVIQGGVVACQTFDERGHYVYLPVKERIAAVVQRAIKWSKLRHIPVSERKSYYFT